MPGGPDVPPGKPITGRDGKTYQRPATKPCTPRADVPALMARVLLHTTDAADCADRVTAGHLRTRTDAAEVWRRQLSEQVARLARLLNDLDAAEPVKLPAKSNVKNHKGATLALARTIPQLQGMARGYGALTVGDVATIAADERAEYMRTLDAVIAALGHARDMLAN